MQSRAASNTRRANVYKRHLETLVINFIRNRIISTNSVGSYGHCGTTMAHMAWSRNRWVLVFRVAIV